MTIALITYAICFLILWLAFRALSQPGSRVPAVVRIASGIVIVCCVAFGALWIQPHRWTLPMVALAAAIASAAIQGDGFAAGTAALGRLRFALFLLSAATLFALVYVFVPITTFLTSPGELSIHIDYLLWTNARAVVVMIYVAALFYALAFSSRMKTALTLFALGALLLGLFYSYVMPFGYPMMTGLSFEQVPTTPLATAVRTLADVSIIVVLSVGLWFVLLRYGGRVLFAAVVIVNVSMCAAAAIGMLRDDVGGAGGPQGVSGPTERPLRFSKNQPNALIIFLDRFMGSYVESSLQSDPALSERLSGFTWYLRSVSAGQNSIAGVHPMLGGYDYLPVSMNARRKPLRDLSTEAFSILPYNFSRKGYRVNVVSPRGLGFTMAGDCHFLEMDGVHCSHIPQWVAQRRAGQLGFPLENLAKSNYTELLVLLGAMRGAPYAGKEILLRRGPWRPFMDHTAGSTFREWAELAALGGLSDTDAAEPNMNFVSNILPHEPYYMSEDCRPMRERFQVPVAEIKRRGHVSLFSLQHAIAAHCALLSVADYMQFLKDRGVYDNTRIVIVSDHGIVGAIEDRSTRATAGGTQGSAYVRTRPLLLVKPRGARGALQISETFMPNAEAPRILCEEIGGCVNPYLANKPITTQGRDDPFPVSVVPWQFSAQKHDAFVIEQHFELVGKDPFDAGGWRIVDPAP